MLTHDLVQGSPEWLAHRGQFDNASDAPAMMGCSPYMTRQQLLHQRATGYAPEVDDATQRRFDEGHRTEALARPIAEEIVGEDLYPVTGTDGTLGASFDGLTMLEDVAYEHKMLNAALRKILTRPGATGADLPLLYRVQMEQQCMVAGCKRVLFMASKWRGDTPEEVLHCWYDSDPTLAAEIRAGWQQFHADLTRYEPPAAAAPVSVASVIETLPALVVTVEGRVTASNLIAFRESADRFLAKIKTELSTDQDFADAEQTVKFCKDGEDRLSLVKEQALAQTASIDELFRTIDHISEQMRQKRLSLDKLVKARKESIRSEIVFEAQSELDAHVVTLNSRLGAPWVPRQQGGFAEAIRGKKTVASVRDAAATALAQAKIAASSMADRLEINRRSLKADGEDWFFLFADFPTVGTKPAEDFAALAALRIDQHRKVQAERDRQAREAAASKEYTEGPDAPQVLKEEAETPDATDRATTADASPSGGSMGAGQPAAAGPAGGPITTLKLCAIISDRLGFTLTRTFVESLGINPVGTEKAAVLFAESDWPRLCDALVAHIQAKRGVA